MPYKNNSSLPDNLRKILPDHAQDIYREAFNHAFEEYKDKNKRRNAEETLEEIAHKVAWSAVKTKYKKSADGWVAKE